MQEYPPEEWVSTLEQMRVDDLLAEFMTFVREQLSSNSR
jgi:hypothetical protein